MIGPAAYILVTGMAGALASLAVVLAWDLWRPVSALDDKPPRPDAVEDVARAVGVLDDRAEVDLDRLADERVRAYQLERSIGRWLP